MVNTGQTAHRIVRFGAFEFDLTTGELRKHGLRIRLQGQPVDVLTMLLEHPGEVVSREDLQKRLWPADTYVQFEPSLSAAMKRLRSALGDSAESPRYIETLARRGYRFIAPIGPAIEASAGEQTGSATPQAGASAGPAPEAARRNIFIVLGAAVTIALLVTFGLSSPAMRGRFRLRAPSPTVRSLAVLPLTDLSGSGGTDYLPDEITDAIRERLAGIRSLRVISRTSSNRYQGSNKPLRQIAGELNIDAVVTGSVARSGDRLRVAVELVEGATDTDLWSGKFDTDVKGVSALQNRIAARVADETRAALTAPERAQLSRVRAFNPDAYDHYSRGRVLWNKRTEDGMRKAIGEFQRATEIDPNYALAWDGIADCWAAIGWYGYAAPSEAFPSAREAVGKALALDDSMAAQHTTLAFVTMYWDRDWEGAEREFRRAVDLNPNYANAHHWYGEFLTLRGRHDEAIAQAERARELDPLSSIINSWVGSRYMFAGRYERALDLYRGAVEMDPQFMSARLVLGQAYERAGQTDEALAELQAAVRLSGGSTIDTASLAHAYAIAGRRSEAEKLYRDLKNSSEKRFVSSYDLAIAAMGLGDRTQALSLLERAYEERSPRVAFIALDQRFDGLHGDPRFQQLKSRLDLP